jgi:hypothetical protein
MGLDIRIPIGLMFAILGGLILIYGFISDPSIYQRSLGVNINVRWGIVMLVFGLVMFFFGRRGSKSAENKESE